MIQFSDITDRLRQIARGGTSRFDRRLMHPAREWYSGLSVALLLLLAGGWYSTNTYITYRDLNPEATDSAPPAVVYRESQVERALILIEERSRTFAAITSAAATSSIPSQTDATAAETTPVTEAATATASTPEMTESAAGTTSPDTPTPNATSGATTRDSRTGPPADTFPVTEEATPQF